MRVLDLSLYVGSDNAPRVTARRSSAPHPGTRPAGHSHKTMALSRVPDPQAIVSPVFLGRWLSPARRSVRPTPAFDSHFWIASPTRSLRASQQEAAKRCADAGFASSTIELRCGDPSREASLPDALIRDGFLDRISVSRKMPVGTIAWRTEELVPCRTFPSLPLNCLTGSLAYLARLPRVIDPGQWSKPANVGK
jgi:hypothetical protein